MSQLTGQEAAELATELLGGDGFAATFEQVSVHFRFARTSLTTNGSTRQTSLSVVAIHDDACVGTASYDGVLDRAAIEDVVARASAAARDASPAEDRSPLVTQAEAGPSVTPWSAPAPSVSLEEVADFTTRLGQLFGSVAPRDYGLYGFAHQELSAVWLATSTGIQVRADQPSGTVAMTGRSHDGQRSTWAGAQAPQLSATDVQEMGARLERQLEWSRTRVEVATGRQEVILSPSAVSDLMVYLHWEMSGRDAAEGRSAWSKPGGGTRLGERIAPAGLSLVSDPSDPRMPCPGFQVATSSGSVSSVFDTGLPDLRTSWITDGEVANLIETRATARESGRPFAMPAGNLILDAGGEGSVEDLVSGTERGLLINSLWYIREVDPVSLLLTGLTRDGVYVIEDGRVVGAASNFRWNESPIGVLGRVIGSSAPQMCLPREWGDYWERAVMPALQVADFNLSSVSEAI